MSLQFVNLYGHRLSIDAMKAQAPAQPKRKTKALPTEERRHMGFVVKGYPPGFEDEAREEHKKAQAAAMKRDPKRAPEPFDIDKAFERKRPKRARSKPFSIPQAANTYAELLRHQGWARVTVTELIR